MGEWVFPSNNNAMITGLNDAGVATFEKTLYESLVREAIQNSLDAKRNDVDGPVEVHFVQEKLPVGSLPGYASLGDALQKCIQLESNDEKTRKFFSDAYSQLLGRQDLRVLRISDYNTIGLEGGTTGRVGSSWSRLVKEAGTSNKDGMAGGSYGIGKSAYFACSMLRTVFFSSLSSNGEKSSIGVARLISFLLDDESMSQGIGYYANTGRFLAFPELGSFCGAAERTRSGTDILVIQNFLIGDTSLVDRLIDAIISNFLVSILKGLLVAKVQDSLINADYVDSYFREKMGQPKESLSKETAQLLEYYKMLRNIDGKTISIVLDSNEYGKELGFRDGECELLIKKGDDLNRRILITRKTGMKLFEQPNISGSISFTGLLYISGSNMNRFFRAMETPAHNKWEPDQQSQEYGSQVEAYRNLREYLRNKVKENFEDKVGDEFDAFDVGQFLPDILQAPEDGEQESGISLQEKKVKISQKKIKATKKKVKTSISLKDLGVEGEGSQKDGGDETGTGTGAGSGFLHSGGHVSGSGRGTGDEPGEGVSPGDGSAETLTSGDGNPHADEQGGKARYKEVESSKRVFCVNPASGLYQIALVAPSKASHVRLDFSISSEQDDYDLNVKNVVLQSSECAVLTKATGNQVYLENLKKGEKIRLTVEVDFIGHCMMEVDYYESKK